MLAQGVLCKKIDTTASIAIMLAEWSNGRKRGRS